MSRTEALDQWKLRRSDRVLRVSENALLRRRIGCTLYSAAKSRCALIVLGGAGAQQASQNFSWSV